MCSGVRGALHSYSGVEPPTRLYLGLLFERFSVSFLNEEDLELGFITVLEFL